MDPRKSSSCDTDNPIATYNDHLKSVSDIKCTCALVHVQQ